jgi:hypothetical protein
MKVLKIAIALLYCSLVVACSQTTHLTSESINSNYYSNDFKHTHFTANHKGMQKKAASSDQQLMLSLLNRPIPEDQRMMLAFAKRHRDYSPDSIIVGTKIMGDKITNEPQEQNTSIYADLIENDINAISIRAMPK